MRGIARCLAGAGLLAGASVARAGCPATDAAFNPDRPGFANSPTVTPGGALDTEFGTAVTGDGNLRQYDLPELRARLGLGDCWEILADFPDLNGSSGHNGVDGWSNFAPALKRQIGRLPEWLTLSVALGVALSTGARQIAGRGAAPYLSVPWSIDLGHDWTLSGMETATLQPAMSVAKQSLENAFVLDKSVTGALDLFTESDTIAFQGLPPENRVGLGAAYKTAAMQQVDVEVRAGLNRAAPDWYVGVGYAIRFNALIPVLLH